MLHLVSITTLLVVCASTLGCFPWPGSYPVTPAMHGRLLQGGMPYAGARVIVTNQDRARDGIPNNTREGVVDSTGAYDVEGIRGSRFPNWLWSHTPRTHWMVSVAPPTGGHGASPGWGLAGVPPAFARLDCDFPPYGQRPPLVTDCIAAWHEP